MARKTFFSFHYGRDSWRAGQVRNSNVVAADDAYGFIDAVDWEKVQRQGDDAIRRWINDQLQNTSVTTVLIGAETAERPWVRHEIVESWNRGNAVLGIQIHNIKDQEQRNDVQGRNPFADLKLPDGTPISNHCSVYDWTLHNGRVNLGAWIEQALAAREKLGDVGKLTHDDNGKGGTSGGSTGGTVPAPRLASSGGFTPRAPWGAR